MADKTIGELPSIAVLYDDSLIPVEQQGAAFKMRGNQFADFGRKAGMEGAAPEVEKASAEARKADSAADSAERSMNGAKADADRAATQANRAENQAQSAEKARKAIEDMTVSAGTLPPGSEATAVKTAVGGSFNIRFGIPRGEQGAVGPKGAQGVQGPPGPQGISGVAVSAAGLYAFNVNDKGHLILSYTGDEAPDFTIRKDGHLWLNIA